MKVPKHPLDLYPDVHTLLPPAIDSDNEDEDPKKKQLLRYRQTTQPLEYYESILKPTCVQQKDFKHILKNIELTDEVSFGQRAFNKNIERLSNQLIAYYKKSHPKDAETALLNNQR